MRLTLLQIMKIVVACALASAYVLPFVRLAEAGAASWPAMLTVGAISIPLVFALTVVFLAREGKLKGWLIRIFCATSVGAALGVCSYGWYMAAAAWVRRGVPMDLRTLTVMTVIGLPVLALGVLLFLLVRGAPSSPSR